MSAGRMSQRQEPLARGLVELRRAAGDVRIGRGAEPLPGAHGEQVLLLRGQELRAVDREERLALADGFPGVVDEEILDVALELRSDLVEERFVEGDAADGADRLASASRTSALPSCMPIAC